MARSEDDALERTVEGYFLEEVKRRGWQERKLDRRTGDPDRLLIAPEGICVFIEFKRPRGGAVSEAQLIKLAELSALGHRAYVCSTKEKVDQIMRFVEQIAKLRSIG